MWGGLDRWFVIFLFYGIWIREVLLLFWVPFVDGGRELLGNHGGGEFI